MTTIIRHFIIPDLRLKKQNKNRTGTVIFKGVSTLYGRSTPVKMYKITLKILSPHPRKWESCKEIKFIIFNPRLTTGVVATPSSFFTAA